MKPPIPSSLKICLIGRHFQILSRSTDHGFLWPIARGLARQGHEVTVLSTRSPLGKFQIERDGVTAYYLKEGSQSLSRMEFSEAAFKKFSELHHENPFHIVHSLDSSGIKIAKHKKALKVAVAYDVEATQMSQLFSILGMSRGSVGSMLITASAVVYKFLTTYFGGDRRLLLSADGVFVTHPQQRLLLERYYLYPDFHTYTVPYGIELGDLTPKEKSIELRRRLNLPENGHVAVTISDMTQLLEVKNLLDAFEKVAIKKPNSYLIIIGNGPLFKEIEFEILSRALGSRVLMTGPLKETEILDYILLGDVFVNMSSRTTGFEPSMIEAMAQKKLIIGSEVSPISNVVADGVDGFLLRPADIDSLSNLLIEIFSGALPVDQIGEKARQKVIELFDTQKMVRALLDAYRKIILNRGNFREARPLKNLASSQV
ncbi:MAG: glycosyltransferase family 4 protein [Bdellovibrionota bacterium]